MKLFNLIEIKLPTTWINQRALKLDKLVGRVEEIKRLSIAHQRPPDALSERHDNLQRICSEAAVVVNSFPLLNDPFLDFRNKALLFSVSMEYKQSGRILQIEAQVPNLQDLAVSYDKLMGAMQRERHWWYRVKRRLCIHHHQPHAMT
jgi:hypothetical protein